MFKHLAVNENIEAVEEFGVWSYARNVSTNMSSEVIPKPPSVLQSLLIVFSIVMSASLRRNGLVLFIYTANSTFMKFFCTSGISMP